MYHFYATLQFTLESSATVKPSAQVVNKQSYKYSTGVCAENENIICIYVEKFSVAKCCGSHVTSGSTFPAPPLAAGESGIVCFSLIGHGGVSTGARARGINWGYILLRVIGFGSRAGRAFFFFLLFFPLPRRR